MLSLDQLETYLIEHGAIDKHEVKYCICFYLPKLKQHIYINKQSGKNYSGLVIHPRYRSFRNIFIEAAGIDSHEELNHKSSYRKYPKRFHGGKQEIPYGIPFGFDTDIAFESFIIMLGNISPLYVGDEFTEVNKAESDGEFNDLPETEKESVINSRRGQGKFRKKLINLWSECSVTGCKNIPILKASHIKPWRDSNNTERLDEFNGFLLTPNLDTVFDGGLISFNDDGRIVISSFLDKDSQSKLGITGNEKLSYVKEEHKKYIKYHNKYIYQK